jgi:hypothetical protein
VVVVITQSPVIVMGVIVRVCPIMRLYV